MIISPRLVTEGEATQRDHEVLYVLCRLSTRIPNQLLLVALSIVLVGGITTRLDGGSSRTAPTF